MELRLLEESNMSLLIHQCPLSYSIFTPQKLCETLYKAFIEPEFSIHSLATETEGLGCPRQEELAALNANMRLFLSGKPLACVEELSAVKKAAYAASAEVVAAATEEVPPISHDSSHAAELLQTPEQSRSHPVLGALSVPIPIGIQKNGVALSVGAALVLTCVFFVFLTSSLTIVGIFTWFAKGAGC